MPRKTYHSDCQSQRFYEIAAIAPNTLCYSILFGKAEKTRTERFAEIRCSKCLLLHARIVELFKKQVKVNFPEIFDLSRKFWKYFSNNSPKPEPQL